MRRLLLAGCALLAVSSATAAGATSKGMVGGGVAGLVGGALIAGPVGAVVGGIGGAMVGDRVTDRHAGMVRHERAMEESGRAR